MQGKPFPYPWEAAATLFSTDILLHTAASLLRWGTGFGIAVAAGVLIGILMALKPLLGELLYPIVHTLQLIPGLAWIPITLLLFGLGNQATIFMITATAIAPVILQTKTGIQLIDRSLLRAAHMMELNPLQTFFEIILPGAAPAIISGLRVSSANAFRVLISAEMVVGSGIGLGYTLMQARWNLDYTGAFGSVLLIAGIGLLFEHALFHPWEKRVLSKRGLDHA